VFVNIFESSMRVWIVRVEMLDMTSFWHGCNACSFGVFAGVKGDVL